MYQAEKKVAIMQPTYLPWIGYFNLIASVDEFVFLDSVQFNKRSWQQRNKIEGNSKEKWLTVPVTLPEGQQTKITDVLLADKAAVVSHLNLIKERYNSSPHITDVMNILTPVYDSLPNDLCSLNVSIITAFCEALSIETKFSHSSVLNIDSAKGELIYSVAEAVDATVYLSAPGSKGYLEDSEVFKSTPISLHYFEQKPLDYPQGNGDFTPYLSIVDLVANVGLEAATDNLRMEIL